MSTAVLKHRGSTVQYKNEYYFLYSLTELGKAKLLRSDGTRFSGTPSINKLHFLKNHKPYMYNGGWYFETKQGMISERTGLVSKLNKDIMIDVFID